MITHDENLKGSTKNINSTNKNKNQKNNNDDNESWKNYLTAYVPWEKYQNMSVDEEEEKCTEAKKKKTKRM